METLKADVANGELKRVYRKQKGSFLRKGLIFAFASGISYGLFSAFLTVGEASGVWNDFWALPIAGTIIGYLLLCAIGSSLNDLISGIWCLVIAAMKGKMRDFLPALKSKPGLMIVVGGLCGGPIASTCYIVGLMMAGGIAAAVTALCTAVGAILSRILFKQKLNARMILGIFICFFAAVVLGGTTLGDVDAKSTIGMCIAFIAAIAWGVEGCIAGYGTIMVDYEIAITIRQLTSGFANLIVLVPVLCIIANATVNMSGVEGSTYLFFVGGALFSTALIWFVISAFFANPAYSLWYKGNSMCGTALGMVCNSMYAFWCPFFMMVLCGWIFGWEGYTLTPVQWLMALVEVFGIWVIAMNPLDVFRKKEA
mgnify:CR=1 FL=1